MELQYFGANCLQISNKKATVTVDDNLEELDLKSVTNNDDIALFTGKSFTTKAVPKLAISEPGEYEVSGISIQGVPTRAHMDEEGAHSSTMYKILIDDFSVVVTGHIYPELDDKQLEALGTVDVLIIPVGGSGYTLDPVGALKIIRKIEPKIVIPTHYADSKIKYPVPQQELESALKELAMEPKQTIQKLKIKPADLVETTQLIVLERS